MPCALSRACRAPATSQQSTDHAKIFTALLVPTNSLISTLFSLAVSSVFLFSVSAPFSVSCRLSVLHVTRAFSFPRLSVSFSSLFHLRHRRSVAPCVYPHLRETRRRRRDLTLGKSVSVWKCRASFVIVC